MRRREESAEEKILRYRKIVDKAKADVGRAEGALESTFAQLKSKYGISGKQELKARISKLKKDLDKAKRRLAKVTDEIERKYEL